MLLIFCIPKVFLFFLFFSVKALVVSVAVAVVIVTNLTLKYVDHYMFLLPAYAWPNTIVCGYVLLDLDE